MQKNGAHAWCLANNSGYLVNQKCISLFEDVSGIDINNNTSSSNQFFKQKKNIDI